MSFEWKVKDGIHHSCSGCDWVAPIDEDGYCEFCALTELGETAENSMMENHLLARGIIQCFHILRGLKP